MQTLDAIKKTLAQMLVKADQYPKITLSEIDAIFLAINPREGLKTHEIKALKHATEQYENERTRLGQFVLSVKGKMVETPKTADEITKASEALNKASNRLLEMINVIDNLQSNVKLIIIQVNERLSDINKENYLKNISTINPAIVFEHFARYEKAVLEYEAAIRDCSEKMSALQLQLRSPPIEYDMKQLAERLAAVESIGDDAFEAQNDYHMTFSKEAWIFQNKQPKTPHRSAHCAKFATPRNGGVQAELKDSKEQRAAQETKERREIETKENGEGINRERRPKNGEENDAENYDWLRNLVEAYKQIFETRYVARTLNINIPHTEQDPAPQLKAFVRHVVQNWQEYNGNIHSIICEAIAKIGGDLVTLDEAFNDDPNKHYGVFKCTEAIELLDNLQDYIHRKMKQLADDTAREIDLHENLQIFDEEDEELSELTASLPSP